MRSTGEVMGIDKDFSAAFAKAALAAGQKLPREGNVFITMTDTFKVPQSLLTVDSVTSPASCRRCELSGSPVGNVHQ